MSTEKRKFFGNGTETTVEEAPLAVKNNVEVKIINKQMMHVGFGVSAEQVALAKALDPTSVVIQDHNGDVKFSIAAVEGNPSISNAGVQISDKKDLFIHKDKPYTKEDFARDYGAAVIQANVVIAKILHTISGAECELAGTVEEVTV